MSLYKLNKNDLEKIIFDLSEFKGKSYINIRFWVRDGALSKGVEADKKRAVHIFGAGPPVHRGHIDGLQRHREKEGGGA